MFHCIHDQKAETTDACVQLTFSYTQSRAQVLEMVLPSSSKGLSTSVNLVSIIPHCQAQNPSNPSQVCMEACLLGDPDLVDNSNHQN